MLEQEEEKEEEDEEEFIEGDDEEDSEAEVRQHLVSGGMQQPRDSPAPPLHALSIQLDTMIRCACTWKPRQVTSE